jgi:hypothetical protein
MNNQKAKKMRQRGWQKCGSSRWRTTATRQQQQAMAAAAAVVVAAKAKVEGDG